MKVLVTAFEPFNNMKNNYSQEVLKYIEDVDKLVVDVVYDQCYQNIINSFDLDSYDLIISMGEARMREELTLELSAQNLSSCSLPDNLGNLKKDEEIMPSGELILHTKVDLSKVFEEIKFSNDAGKFVCNNLYYHLLANYSTKVLFIHVPECHDDEKMYQKLAAKIQKIITILGGNK